MPVSTALDGLPRPPGAETLGWEIVDARPADGWIRTRFEARQEFLNPAGFVQGGFVTAMLDDTMGPAVLLATEGRSYTVTTSLNVNFIAPARAGAFTGEGQVVSLGKTIAFIEAKLRDADGTLVATATSSARLVPIEKLAA